MIRKRRLVVMAVWYTRGDAAASRAPIQTKSRVKLLSTQSLLIRTSMVTSRILGTLFTDRDLVRNKCRSMVITGEVWRVTSTPRTPAPAPSAPGARLQVCIWACGLPVYTFIVIPLGPTKCAMNIAITPGRVIVTLAVEGLQIDDLYVTYPDSLATSDS